jgi:hypothetical protein
MVPPESLSQYLSNEYQCYGVSIESSNYQYILHNDFGDKRRPPFLRVKARLTISLLLIKGQSSFESVKVRKRVRSHQRPKTPVTNLRGVVDCARKKKKNILI